MDNQDLYKQIRNDTEYLASEAGKILADTQDKFKVVKMKDAVDLATSADLASEKFIIDFIKNKYPDHSIYSEEAGIINPNHDFLWIIDPLDGTKEYVKGLEEYNCLIGVEYKNELVVGSVRRNGVNELYSGAQGLGSYLNHKQIHVSNQSDLANSFIGFHMPTRSQTEAQINTELRLLHNLINKTYRIRPAWDDAKSIVWVARGILDGHIIGKLKGWFDVAAALAILKEAGGTVTDWRGNDIKNQDISHGLVVSNSVIHKNLLNEVNNINI